MDTKKKRIFKNASTTYYYSSMFFEPRVKRDVYTLYAFVRVADDYIDTIPPKKKEFKEFRQKTDDAIKGTPADFHIIDDFVELYRRRGFKKRWVTSFLDAMEADLTKKEYKTFKELEEYMHGSAEVIGLFMSRIFGLQKEAFQYAELQGKAMQLINFIRDVHEDNELGRQYLPTEDLNKFKTSIPPKKNEAKRFEEFMRFEIDRYFDIQKEAEKGYRYIPKNYLIMVKTSARMYNWTARQIYKNPMIVFEKKVKPSKARVIGTAIKNWVTL